MSPPFALALLTGCASAPQVVYRDRPISVPVPVVRPLPAELTADCPPAGGVAPGALTVGAVLTRLADVEDALAKCRGQLAQIRALPPN